MSFWSKLFGGGDSDVYGEPYEASPDKWRIRIFQMTGSKKDYLFISSVEDVYPDRAAAVRILKSVKGMKITR